MATLTTRASKAAAKNGRKAASIPARERFPGLAELIDYLDSLTGRADLAVLQRLLGGLRITRADVEAACEFGTRGYRRNTISRSDRYELLALCWRPGHCTPIHDHRGVSCAFRVVAGTGTEVRFALTPSGVVCPAATNTMPPGYVCAADEADIHQVVNTQPPGTDLVTLHIYSPPIKKMHVYCYPTSNGAENQVYDAACETTPRAAARNGRRSARRR